MDAWRNRIQPFLERIESNSVICGIRNGMVMAMPVLLLGSISLIIKTFSEYLLGHFNPAGIISFLIYLTTFIYNVTFGALSLYVTVFISLCTLREYKQEKNYTYGAISTAVGVYLILSGGLGENFSLTTLGVKGMFIAILAAVGVSPLYCVIARRIAIRKQYSQGADERFNQALVSSIPMIIILIIFSVFSFLLDKVFHIQSIQQLFVNLMNHIFIHMGNGLGSGILYVGLTSVLWFFGIHGSDVLENVSDMMLVPAMNENIERVKQGLEATNIFTKTFVDTFVVMGGCGALMCAFAVILLFGKSRRNRSLARTAALPLLFNVNEIIVFGFPVVFNPYLLIPFLFTPIIFALTSSFAMYIGLVPLATKTVVWTMPVFINGYLSTGSIAGSILQLFNLALGICIYFPFIKMYENSQTEETKRRVKDVIRLLQESENNNTEITLIDVKDERGNIAKIIATDIKQAMEKNEMSMYYQPQFNEKKEYIGAEALLRWNHPVCGMIYPPLVIKLADEIGILTELEKYIFKRVVSECSELEKKYGTKFRVSVNSSAKTIQKAEFVRFLQTLANRGCTKNKNICIEITEQAALSFDKATEDKLKNIKEMGYLLAIDDFAMGNTSLKYLQSTQFDVVKLDGSLVKRFEDDKTSKEIIRSIVQLSEKLGFSVLAEYVENEQLMEELNEVGCRLYQGYLVSPAVTFERMME